jgi:hypothetical protein
MSNTATLQYTQVSETTAELDWADLATLDLAKYDLPNGKQELAAELTRAIEEVGKLLQKFSQTCDAKQERKKNKNASSN